MDKLKIIIYSSTFWPAVGGIENIMLGLAEEWQIMGHSLQVFTRTKQSTDKVSFGFPILDNYSTKQFLRAVSDADIYVEANISFKNILIGLLNRKKWWVIHHVHYDHQLTISGYFKKWSTFFSNNICVSSFLARKLSASSVVIPNFFSTTFFKLERIQKRYDFVFLGRLVSDKGVDRLIQAIARMGASCLLIGDGDERSLLEKHVCKLGLNDFIHFKGILLGEELTIALNSAKVMVIPSIWDEPFGVVALEGMACGCIIACSDVGGLREATNNLAFYFDPKNQDSMLDSLSSALVFDTNEKYHQAVENHLAQHSRSFIAQKYINIFENTRI